MSREAHVRSLWEPGGEIPPGDPTGNDLRERGHRARAERVTDQAIALLAPRIGTRAACRADRKSVV